MDEYLGKFYTAYDLLIPYLADCWGKPHLCGLNGKVFGRLMP